MLVTVPRGNSTSGEASPLAVNNAWDKWPFSPPSPGAATALSPCDISLYRHAYRLFCFAPQTYCADLVSVASRSGRRTLLRPGVRSLAAHSRHGKGREKRGGPRSRSGCLTDAESAAQLRQVGIREPQTRSDWGKQDQRYGA